MTGLFFAPVLRGGVCQDGVKDEAAAGCPTRCQASRDLDRASGAALFGVAAGSRADGVRTASKVVGQPSGEKPCKLKPRASAQARIVVDFMPTPAQLSAAAGVANAVRTGL